MTTPILNAMRKGEIIKNSIDKYEDKEVAIQKYTDAIVYNFFSPDGKLINLTSLGRKRCKLLGTDIETANERAKDIIAAIQNEERGNGDNKSNDVKPNDEIVKESTEIYKSGGFLEHLRKTFAQYWYGDFHILAWVAIQFVNSWIRNPNIGLHIHLTGPSSTGKSDAVKAAMRLLPPEYCIIGSFTRKAVIYKMKNLSPGSSILHDDHVADDDEMELNRAIISAWPDGYDYISVADGETHTVRLPPRINRIITNTKNISDELSAGQDDSRFITIELSRDKKTAKEICSFIQQEHPFPERDAEICRTVFKMITEMKPTVSIPILTEIQDPMQIRRVKQEMTVIKSVTILNGRTTAMPQDITDAYSYIKFSRKMISTEIPGLGKNERILYREILKFLFPKNGALPSGMSLNKLKERSQVPAARFYEALRGDHGTFEAPTGGLLATISGLHIIDEWDENLRRNEKMLIFAADVKKIGEEFYMDRDPDDGNDSVSKS